MSFFRYKSVSAGRLDGLLAGLSDFAQTLSVVLPTGSKMLNSSG